MLLRGGAVRVLLSAVLYWLLFAATATAGVWIALSPAPALIQLAAVVLIASALYWLLAAVEGTARGFEVLRCCLSPRRLQQHVFEDSKPKAGIVPSPLMREEVLLQELGGSVVETLGHVADVINAAPQEGIVRDSDELVWHYLLELQQQALVLGRRWRRSESEVPSAFPNKPFRLGRAAWDRLVRRAQARIVAVGEGLKDVILDMGETDTPWLPDPVLILPWMSRERFIEVMRGPCEAALRRAVRAINESDTEEAAAWQMHDAFAALHHDLLEVGLDMRLAAWREMTSPPARIRSDTAGGFPLRKAADPPLPRSQQTRLRWADKYRRMRAAGTSLPFAPRSI